MTKHVERQHKEEHAAAVAGVGSTAARSQLAAHSADGAAAAGGAAALPLDGMRTRTLAASSDGDHIDAENNGRDIASFPIGVAVPGGAGGKVGRGEGAAGAKRRRGFDGCDNPAQGSKRARVAGTPGELRAPVAGEGRDNYSCSGVSGGGGSGGGAGGLLTALSAASDGAVDAAGFSVAGRGMQIDAGAGGGGGGGGEEEGGEEASAVAAAGASWLRTAAVAAPFSSASAAVAVSAAVAAALRSMAGCAWHSQLVWPPARCGWGSQRGQ
jgi:hypothetical protein